MPYHDDEYPGQPLWQSVVLFCCKGVIEVIMVLLFFWLLIQVLFSKQLEDHLQVLLIVGLVVFCLSLTLGCFLCWRMSSDNCGVRDKEPVASAPADPVTPSSRGPAAAVVGVARLQWEEPEGEAAEFPSTFSSPTPSSSSDAATAHAFEFKEHPRSYFPLRRLSSPSVVSSPLYKPMASFPSLPRLGLLSKVLERRRSSVSERSRLTGASSPSAPEEPIPLATLNYGSDCRPPPPPPTPPRLDFTMAFSPERGALTVRLLALAGAAHRLDEVSVLGSLAPLCPCPVQASPRPHRGPGPEPCGGSSSPGLALRVGSLEELRRCVLRLAVYTRQPPSLRGSALGEVEVQCGGKEWRPDQPLHVSKELSPNKWKRKQSLTSQDASTAPGLSCAPQPLGQLFILLQYQTLAHRLKAMVLRADNLGFLAPTPHAPDYQVVVVLRHDGAVIGTRETRGVGGANTVWNSPCHFDLPPGDVAQLPLMLEFIVTQNQVHSNSAVLGRVLIGAEAPEAGRTHWRDVCSQGEVERARWHTVQPETL